MWHPVRPKGSQGGGVESARRDPQSGRYEFRAPQGTLRIWAQDPRFSAENRAPDDAAPLSVTSQGVDYVAAPESLVVAGARVEHTLRLRPNCGFVLRLKYGTSAVPFGEEERVRCRALLGDGRAIGAYREDGAWRFVVSEPGAYELAFPRIARYAPIPTQTVTVLAAQFVEHVVALEREHP
jgi:hypothetical protein